MGGGTCMGSVRKHAAARGPGAGGTRLRSKPARAFISTNSSLSTALVMSSSFYKEFHELYWSIFS